MAHTKSHSKKEASSESRSSNTNHRGQHKQARNENGEFAKKGSGSSRSRSERE